MRYRVYVCRWSAAARRWVDSHAAGRPGSAIVEHEGELDATNQADAMQQAMERWPGARPENTVVIADPERPAWLNFDDWAGRNSVAVIVVGETPKRYRIRADQRIRLAGCRRYLELGATVLVPRTAVSFDKPRCEPGQVIDLMAALKASLAAP